MKNALVALIIVLSTACVSNARLDTLERRNAELAEENARYRTNYVQQIAPQAPAAQGEAKVAQGDQVSTGTIWAYQKHGVYLGTAGEQSRQVTQGRKLKLNNQVCDEGSRSNWLKCIDVDDNGAVDLNTWLAFEIDGQPVVCDSGFIHPEAQVSLLPPGQTCHFEVGRSRVVKLKIKAYRNSGTASYVMLDSSPDRTVDKVVRIGHRNVKEYTVGESTF